MTQDRIIMRDDMKKVRSHLSVSERRQLSLLIEERVLSYDSYRHANHVAYYYSAHNEVTTDGLIEQAWLSHKEVYLPRLSQPSIGVMDFCRYTRDTKLEKNTFQITEPSESLPVDIEILDIIFLPIVACDKQGNRLGMGAGFYDKTLVGYDKRTTILAGLAYDFQVVESIHAESWDVPIDVIFTETACYSCQS